MKLSTLKKSAQSCTAWRGHHMTWSIADDHAMTGRCRVCGRGVTICDNPMPNDIAIGGEALAVHCDSVD